ncbi:hypothetical protein QEH57_16260 [Pelagicoccus sp. SDUM812005]|nr:hypothetical protein [Pelagicoccus sp. SDUM812005]
MLNSQTNRNPEKETKTSDPKLRAEDETLIPWSVVAPLIGFKGELPEPLEEAVKNAKRKPRKTNGQVQAEAVAIKPQHGRAFLTEGQLATLARQNLYLASGRFKACAVAECLKTMASKPFHRRVADQLKPAFLKLDTSGALQAAMAKVVDMEVPNVEAK